MTIYSFDLKSRRIGTMDYPVPIPLEDTLIDCVLFLNHCDQASGLQAVSTIGPNLTLSAGMSVTAAAAVYGAAGLRATATEAQSASASGLSFNLTSRHIDFEGWFRLRTAASGSGRNRILWLTRQSISNFAYIEMNNSGTAATFVYRGSTGGDLTISLPTLALVAGAATHIAWSYNYSTGALSIYVGKTRIHNSNIGANLFNLTMDGMIALQFDNTAGGTGRIEADELRLTACTQPRYSGATIEVIDLAFPDI